MSCLDGACFYDQLHLDSNLAVYFGRPQVRVRELCEPLRADCAGFPCCGDEQAWLSLEQVRAFLLDNGGGDQRADDWLSSQASQASQASHSQPQPG